MVLVFHGAEYGAVVTSVPALPSRKNCTPMTASLSAALVVTVIVPETVAPLLGDVTATVGDVVSIVTFSAPDTDDTLFVASVAVAVMLWAPSPSETVVML